MQSDLNQIEPSQAVIQEVTFDDLPEEKKAYYLNEIAPLIKKGLDLPYDEQCPTCNRKYAKNHKDIHYLISCRYQSNKIVAFTGTKKIKNSFIYNKINCEFCNKSFNHLTDHNILEHYCSHFKKIYESLNK
jgi:hypothetical protein